MPVLVLRDLDELTEAELCVARRRLAPARRPLRELPDQHAQERGLELVEARVVADELEVGLVARAVEREHADALGEVVVVRGDEARRRRGRTGSWSGRS